MTPRADANEGMTTRPSSSSQGEQDVRKEIRGSDEGGRRAILVLFFLTLGLSLAFFLQTHLWAFLSEFFGPSTWTFSR